MTKTNQPKIQSNRTGTSWPEEEDGCLISEYCTFCKTVALKHGRSINDIIERLQHLGVMK